MADQLIKEQIGEFLETFNMFDVDCDERLSMVEFGTMLKALGQHVSEVEIIKMMGKQNEQEGFIDFQTFLTLMARKIKENDTEEELIEAFKVFDKNCDGFITAGELKLSMNGRGERLDDTEVDEMIHEADLDSDGQINYDEFVRMMVAK
mmetsp:Transcript_32/g.44  ORF Transcript_32/g.44 Transcript_32/m.44 type:complete len:149 (-) Transcript_32:222-668(-)|eukprot:CAMPEP_0115129320 /NCGR_PEP_ID=MMETSP0227-20121206/51721_1 /TAXON_ID=89957 /ORGANISM="Polarella glacialis, Strain CCMP 1383" /LENGTH=148 /DNA_ID=CAMNT_0002534167 /DNA_START=64 /DNA_END=510 /DNA_ORIENTATION=+